jgi:hypothetical protein
MHANKIMEDQKKYAIAKAKAFSLNSIFLEIDG